MKMRPGVLVGGVVFAIVFSLQTQVQSADPVRGKALFEKQWQWNDSAESFSEIDLDNPIPTTLIGRVARRGDIKPAIAKGDGLGPLHNATSCKACHEGGGASGVEHNVTLLTVEPRSDFFRQIGPDSGKAILNFFPGLLSSGQGLSFNTVVHDASTRDGYRRIRQRLSKHVPGEIDQAWFNPTKRTAEAISKQPVVAGRYHSLDYYLSQRNSPALFGLGQLDSIPLDRMRALAVRQSTSTGGQITGRVAGKFGWRGQVATLGQFVRGACAGELGLNQGASAAQANDPADREYVSPHPDILENEVWTLTSFVASLPQPVEQPGTGDKRTTIRKGEAIFNSVGCAICHVPEIRPVSGLFSDLLLHDMGAELQAPFPAPVGELGTIGLVDPVRFTGREFSRPAIAPGYYGAVFQTRPPMPYPFPTPSEPQFPRGEIPEAELNGAASTTWDAMQREWKTPPLWGVADSAPYLHDGRAETLEQAILWHGGESKMSRKKFERLNRDQKSMLIAFLKSLRAPMVEL